MLGSGLICRDWPTQKATNPYLFKLAKFHSPQGDTRHILSLRKNGSWEMLFAVDSGLLQQHVNSAGAAIDLAGRHERQHVVPFSEPAIHGVLEHGSAIA